MRAPVRGGGGRGEGGGGRGEGGGGEGVCAVMTVNTERPHKTSYIMEYNNKLYM